MKRLAVLLLLAAAAPPAARDSVTALLTRPAQAGQSVAATIRGYQTRRYTIAGRPGRRLDVRVVSANHFLYFNVDAPSGTTLYDDSIGGAGRFGAVMEERGAYVVLVYLMRNEARRGHIAPFRLTVAAAQP